MLTLAEYLWLDGDTPSQQLRSKTRVISISDGVEPRLLDFPEWGFDGSSTYQAEGSDSDLILRPVNFVRDPIRGNDNYIVMCEVQYADGMPHGTNTRAQLREALRNGGAQSDPWIGFEQEYTLYMDSTPLGWPSNGYPAPQGPFYCGVGADKVFGRQVVEAHTAACMGAGLMLYGINAEVMPGQWEFQIGYRGVEGENADPVNVSDHMWIARWLLQRICEDHGITARFDAKPVKGDWNGAGAHTNFSTRAMRDRETGLRAIETAIERLEATHAQHIANYGHGLEDRLTGLHETSAIDEFRGGVADRGASIRIPRHVMERGFGYLEDRRPAANCDPYTVANLLVSSIIVSERTQPQSALAA